jgi:hypothetical protein
MYYGTIFEFEKGNFSFVAKFLVGEFLLALAMRRASAKRRRPV